MILASQCGRCDDDMCLILISSLNDRRIPTQKRKIIWKLRKIQNKTQTRTLRLFDARVEATEREENKKKCHVGGNLLDRPHNEHGCAVRKTKGRLFE